MTNQDKTFVSAILEKSKKAHLENFISIYGILEFLSEDQRLAFLDAWNSYNDFLINANSGLKN